MVAIQNFIEHFLPFSWQKYFESGGNGLQLHPRNCCPESVEYISECNKKRKCKRNLFLCIQKLGLVLGNVRKKKNIFSIKPHGNFHHVFHLFMYIRSNPFEFTVMLRETEIRDTRYVKVNILNRAKYAWQWKIWIILFDVLFKNWIYVKTTRTTHRTPTHTPSGIQIYIHIIFALQFEFDHENSLFK